MNIFQIENKRNNQGQLGRHRHQQSTWWCHRSLIIFVTQNLMMTVVAAGHRVDPWIVMVNRCLGSTHPNHLCQIFQGGKGLNPLPWLLKATTVTALKEVTFCFQFPEPHHYHQVVLATWCREPRLCRCICHRLRQSFCWWPVRQRRQRASSRFEFGRLHDAVSQLHVIVSKSLTLSTLSHKQHKHSKWICNGQVVDVSQNEVASEPALWNRNPLRNEVAYPHFTYGVLGSWPMWFIHMMIELNWTNL